LGQVPRELETTIKGGRKHKEDLENKENKEVSKHKEDP
jgi:hypothetical protein